jgi:hypothetical protein
MRIRPDPQRCSEVLSQQFALYENASNFRLFEISKMRGQVLLAMVIGRTKLCQKS